MLASRLWFALLGLLIGFLTFTLYVGASLFDRTSKRATADGLAADVQVVSWYLKDDARRRSSALINFSLDDELAKALTKAGATAEKFPADAREKAKKHLMSVEAKLPADLKFTALFAVDPFGRVVAQQGFDQASGIEDFELGGYGVVADALHGWIRDDAWILDGRIYRVVARPVEGDTSLPPAGAIVGLRIVDDTFARELSRRTGAAVAFYTAMTRVASAAPEGTDVSQLDTITSDLSDLKKDELYQKKGRSDVRTLHDTLSVVYAKLPGEAWDMGAGFAVGREATVVSSPLGFLRLGDDKDKHAGNLPVVILLTLLSVGIGLAWTVIEYNRPLGTMRREAKRMARGEVDQLAPSKFRGQYRNIIMDLNEGVDKVTAKGGVIRKAADLEQVLGPLPAQPMMSAFSVPSADTSANAFGPASPGAFNPFSPGSRSCASCGHSAACAR